MTDSNNKPDVKQDFLAYCKLAFNFTPNNFQLDIAEKVLKGQSEGLQRARAQSWSTFRKAFNAYLNANKGKYGL